MIKKDNYQVYDKESMAKVVGRSLPISTKASIEICNTLRGKSLARAKAELRKVINMKLAVKYRRFTEGAGHKRGIGAGKYPIKAAQEILNTLESAEANAQFKGLNTSGLMIKSILANKGGNTWRYGRRRRIRMKRTHLEIILDEGMAKKSKDKEKEHKEGNVKEIIPTKEVSIPEKQEKVQK